MLRGAPPVSRRGDRGGQARYHGVLHWTGAGRRPQRNRAPRQAAALTAQASHDHHAPHANHGCRGKGGAASRRAAVGRSHRGGACRPPVRRSQVAARYRSRYGARFLIAHKKESEHFTAPGNRTVAYMTTKTVVNIRRFFPITEIKILMYNRPISILGDPFRGCPVPAQRL